MLKKSDITVLNHHNGITELMAMNGNHLFRHRYIGYNVKEAKALFIADTIEDSKGL